MTPTDLLLGAYAVAMTAAAPVIVWRLGHRAQHGKEDRARIAERRGVAGRPRPDGRLVWLHAASVGEAQSALPLIARLGEELPGATVLVTTGTVTSADMLTRRLPERAFHQFVPVDRPAWVRRFLDHWRPDLALWLESELWPNLVLRTRARGIPMALVNARLSARSHARWRHAAGPAARLLQAFDIVLAQDPKIAERLRDLGARDVRVTGTLKYADDPLPHDPKALAALKDAVGDRPCWLAASLHPGEADAVLAAHRELSRTHPQLLTILVPRHAPRASLFDAAARSRGIAVATRSADEVPSAAAEVYIADTMGELGLFYRLAPVAFVGGSLINHGGQNLLEPARLDCAIVHGPHVHNFASVAAELRLAGGAIEVADAEALAAAVRQLLDDDAKRAAICAAANAVAAGKRDVLDKVMALLRPLLPTDAEAGVRARA